MQTRVIQVWLFQNLTRARKLFIRLRVARTYLSCEWFLGFAVLTESGGAHHPWSRLLPAQFAWTIAWSAARAYLCQLLG